MADPLSITSLALQIGITLKQLYDYGKQVKSAKSDIKQLCLELSALRSLVEDFKVQNIGIANHSALSEALQDARTSLDELLVSLSAPSSTLKSIKQSLKWPLRDGDVKRILSRLERAKTMLMLYLMGDLQSIRDTFDDMSSNVQAILANQENQRVTESHQKVLELIAPVSPRFAHRRACSIWREFHSSSWFIDGPLNNFLNKPQPAPQMIALVGISGSGKSTLISKCIEHLSVNSTVAYMYCMYNDAQTQEARNILGSFVAQLWHLQPDVLDVFQSYVTAMEPVPLSVLSEALVRIADSNGGIILVIDALNECKAPAKVSLVLSDLVKRSTAIRILLSSSHSDSTVSQLCDEDLCTQFVLTAERVQPDIDSYIRREVAQHGVLKRMPETEIVESVMTRANGMFRWAKCQMDLLTEQATPKKVRQALAHLPETLYDTYVVLLQRVGDASKETVRGTLLWLSLSQRPLTLRELVEIVAFDVDETSVDDDCRIEPSKKLIEMCHGLVVRDVATDNVILAHGSIRPFLTSDFIRTSPAAYYAIEESAGRQMIVQKCLSYLLMPQFGIGMCPRGTETFAQLLTEYPLLDYAGKYWAVHAAAQESLTSEQVLLINRLFWTHRLEKDGGNFTFWVNCLISESDRSIISAAEPLYYAASFGLTEIVASMLQNSWVGLENEHDPWYIDHSCGRATSTALQVACWRGHFEVASLLLKAGANPDSRNIVGATCLRCARRRGHSEIEQLLMSVGAQDEYGPKIQQLVLDDSTQDHLEHLVSGPSSGAGVSPIRRAISEALGVELSMVTDEADLASLGVDSLVAIEVRSRLRETTGSDIVPLYLLMSKTVKEIEDIFERGARLLPKRRGLDIAVVDAPSVDTVCINAPAQTTIVKGVD